MQTQSDVDANRRGWGDRALDLDALAQISNGITRLRGQMEDAATRFQVLEHGYLLPDEDDEARRLFLSYRNYRLALFEIIERNVDFANIDNPTAQAQSFLLALGAALTLYSASGLLINNYRDLPAIRRKLNEPDPSYGIEAGLFDQIYQSLTSIRNLTRLRDAVAFYEMNQDELYWLTVMGNPEWAWLFACIDSIYPALKRHDLDALRDRVRRGWDEWKSRASRPFKDVAYQLSSLLIDSIGNFWLGAHPEIPEDHRLAFAQLMQPGDFIMVRPERKSSTVLIPGWWTHCAFFHGGWEQLEALGATQLPHVRKAEEQLTERASEPLQTLEALSIGVVLSPLRRTLNVDHAVAIRPRFDAPTRLATINDAFSHLGKPYDFDLDFSRTDRVVCTEVIYRALHGKGAVRFQPVTRYGRPTLSADDIAASIVRAVESGSDAFEVIALSKRNLRAGTSHFYTGPKAMRLFRRIDATQQ